MSLAQDTAARGRRPSSKRLPCWHRWCSRKAAFRVADRCGWRAEWHCRVCRQSCCCAEARGSAVVGVAVFVTVTVVVIVIVVVGFVCACAVKVIHNLGEKIVEAVVASLATEVFPQAYQEDRHLAGIATAAGVLLALALGELA